MKKLKKMVWNSLNAVKIGGVVQLILKSALTEVGWFRSYHTKQSIDKDGKPLPWCTYPFIHFIEPRLHQQMHIFEFGCGNSTLWYASRVKSIVAVEHDESWVKLMQSKSPTNAKILFRQLDDQDTYAKTVTIQKQLYHIIIIDGRQRNMSAQLSLGCLTEDGIVIWDNSDRPQYQDTIAFLQRNGFKKIDFWGMCPVASHLTCTTIFYKPTNCLNI